MLMNTADLAAPDLREQNPMRLHDSLKSGERFEWRHQRKDGSELPVDILVRPIDSQGEKAIVMSVRDNTIRKQLEFERKRFVMLAESSSEFIGMCDLDMTPIYVNPAGQRMVGLSGMDAACQVKVEDYFFPDDQRFITEEFFPKVLREGKGDVEIRLRHFQTGKAIWVFYYLFSVQDEAGMPIGWATVSHDITERKNMQLQKEEDAQHLKKALLGTIQSIALTITKRDVFTSTHLIRVEQLAKAIGVELGLSKDTLEGLCLGASILDIGKVSIPADLLIKPGKFSAIEYQLIKQHSITGYEIVKDVEFPWPIADMILQHHERLDGSGYPQGLYGDAIILEARILAVADVFEAMLSHRPYRPALDMQAAIEIIESGKGTLFDAKVVDACIDLFRHKSFVFDKIEE
jgi:PAS domain S-box-containing protein